MSKEFHWKWKWPINSNRGWKIQAATKATEDLFAACLDVTVKIGDVEIDQNFFVQDEVSHFCDPRATLYHSFTDGDKGARYWSGFCTNSEPKRRKNRPIPNCVVKS